MYHPPNAGYNQNAPWQQGQPPLPQGGPPPPPPQAPMSAEAAAAYKNYGYGNVAPRPGVSCLAACAGSPACLCSIGSRQLTLFCLGNILAYDRNICNYCNDFLSIQRFVQSLRDALF